MQEISPRILQANLWMEDGRLGKTLDALFARKEQHIAGLIMGYHYADGTIIPTGPAQIAARCQDHIRLYEDLPSDDGLSAAIGRAIQAVFSAAHIVDYLERIETQCPLREDGETLQALFSPSGVILYHEDPWFIVDQGLESGQIETMRSKLCTLVLRPAMSAHERLLRAKRAVEDLGIFHDIQSNGLDTLKAQEVASFKIPTESEVSRFL